MAFVNWDSKYSIGVESMDGEHKQIINLMNQLWMLSEVNSSRRVMLPAAKKLAMFTLKHFDDEEAYMSSINFPGLTAHMKLHDDVLRKLKEHLKGYIDSGRTDMPDAFFDFLTNWLVAHICGIDKQYAKHATRVGRAA